MSNELMHHGVLGMKWGVRRYQNKDGSLTAAGRAKANRLQASYNRLTGKKLHTTSNDVDVPKKQKPKKISEMTDQEIRDRIDRIRLENTLKSLTPEKTSKGESFIKKYGSTMANKLWNDVGKNKLSSYIDKKFGLGKTVSQSERLAQEAKDLRNRVSIEQSRKALDQYNTTKPQNSSETSLRNNNSTNNSYERSSNNSNIEIRPYGSSTSHIDTDSITIRNENLSDVNFTSQSAEDYLCRFI